MLAEIVTAAGSLIADLAFATLCFVAATAVALVAWKEFHRDPN